MNPAELWIEMADFVLNRLPKMYLAGFVLNRLPKMYFHHQSPISSIWGEPLSLASPLIPI